MKNSGKQQKMCTQFTITLYLFSLFSFTTQQQKISTVKTGQELFENKCAQCHGSDGTRGKWGAKNLQLSVMTDDELFYTITNGKKIMPAWKNTLTQEDIRLVKNYIKTLRK